MHASLGHADDDRRSTAAVLVAAGSATRMGPASERKPFLELEGRTLLEHCAAAFAACSHVQTLIVVARGDDVERVRELARGRAAFAKLATVVEGGAERADSVRAGVLAAGNSARLVAIHDAARPLVSTDTIARAIEAAAEHGAALVATRASDSIHRSQDGRTANEALERRELWCAQTPQVFERARLLQLLGRALADAWSPTDDAALWERYAGPVALVEGSQTNLKITTPVDLVVARALLRAVQEATR